MGRYSKLLQSMKENPHNIRFSELVTLCTHYFGQPRNKGSSHWVFKTPWPGDPRVNIQKSKGGKAKAYQVRQVLAAINKLEEQ